MSKNYYLYFVGSSFSLAVGLFFITTVFLTHAYDEPSQPVTPTQPTESRLLNRAVFRENEQSTVLLNPTFNDRSTNIAFYIKCPTVACPDTGTIDSPIYIFSAENLGNGTKPFSEYWAPPVLTDYIAIEYKNDAQQFSCSDKTVEACTAGPHFVAMFDFALVGNSTIITPEMLAAKNETSNTLVATTIPTTSSASDALKKLSIDLSATSITSSLEDDQMVTATLDGISAPTTSTGTLETGESPSVGKFLLNIVESVIEIFIPDEPTEPMLEETTLEPLAEPVTEDNQPSESAIQSSIVVEETSNDTTTSEF